jgi:hypothetical protein
MEIRASSTQPLGSADDGSTRANSIAPPQLSSTQWRQHESVLSASPTTSLPPTLLDPAKVLQLVVQLAEVTQRAEQFQQESIAHAATIERLERDIAELRTLLATARSDQEQQATLLLDKVDSYKAKAKASRRALQELLDTTSKDFDAHRQLSDHLAAENVELRSTIQSSSKRFVSQIEEAEKTIISLQEQVDASREEAAEARAIAEQRKDLLFRERSQMQLELAQAEARFTMDMAKLNRSLEQQQQQQMQRSREELVESSGNVVVKTTISSSEHPEAHAQLGSSKELSKRHRDENRQKRRGDLDTNKEGKSERRRSSSRTPPPASSRDHSDHRRHHRTSHRRHRSERSGSTSSEQRSGSSTASTNSRSSSSRHSVSSVGASSSSSRRSSPARKSRRSHCHHCRNRCSFHKADRKNAERRSSNPRHHNHGIEVDASHLNVSGERSAAKNVAGSADIPKSRPQQTRHSTESHRIAAASTPADTRIVHNHRDLVVASHSSSIANARSSSSMIPQRVRELMDSAARQGTQLRRRDHQHASDHVKGDPYALVEQHQRREEQLSELDAQADALRRTRNDRVIQSVDMFLSRVDFLR